MTARTEMKRAARQNLKRHYWVFAVTCLIAAFLGAEYSSTFNTLTSSPKEQQIADAETGSSGGVIVKKAGAIDVLNEIINGDTKQGEKLADELRKEHIQNARHGNAALGRTRGILAQAVNSISSGSIFVTLASALNAVTGSASLILSLLILLSLFLAMAVWFFIVNVYTVVSSRIFLEGRKFETKK